MESFKVLYEVLVKGEKVEVSDELLEQTLELASLNKVLLQFLRDLDLRGDLREREEMRYDMFIKAINEISGRLEGLNYAFFKILKPAYVPSDIDLLIDNTHLVSAISKLKELGYVTEVIEPYCITLSSPRSIIDLYLHPTMGGVIYLDGKRLLEFRREIYFNGVRIPALEGYVEALVSAAHAIFKERIYTLNDYLVLAKLSSNKTFKLAEELGCVETLLFAFKLNDSVEKGYLTLPYKVPLPLWLNILGSKVLRDPRARASLPNIIKALRDPRAGKLIFSKIFRRSY
ncbi:MAG: hypothetical protein J7J65_04060 [Candidatus Korarchaeota archaeon]|nr:hypothetical protein [Candidatus Korarchaeota archaeon]